jgi:hypothetical protein
MTTLKNCWHWFWRQSRLNKIIILGLFAVIVPFCLPTVVSWFRPTIIKVGVAFYTYERASLSEGTATTYFFEKRNLVTNCSLRRIEETQPTGQAAIVNPQSWVTLKLLLENASDQQITHLRLGVRSPALSPATQLLTSPNVDATGRMDTPSRDTRPAYIISIAAIAPATSTVLSLQTPIDDRLRRFIYEDHRTVTVQVPFVSADQFREYPPIVSRTNAIKILNREGLLRTGDDREADEALTATLMPSGESGTSSKVTPYQLLPKSRTCSDGEAGMW